MGYWKKQSLNAQDRGYRSSDQVICADCVGDSFLHHFIVENGSINTCSFCMNEHERCVLLETLMEPIMAGIYEEYDQAGNCMGWESKEGGFQGAHTYDTYDLVYDELCQEFDFNSDAVNDPLDAVYKIMEETTWCERDPYSVRPHDEVYYSWRQFCETVESGMPLTHQITNILHHIANGIRELGLVRTVPKGTLYFRGRCHLPTQTVVDAATLGSPPEKYAQNNRMFPAGQSTFHGALDRETARTEVCLKQAYTFTLGRFYTQRPITVVDLSLINHLTCPSLFDTGHSTHRVLILFLHRFSDSISAPMEGERNTRYRATQHLTKYLLDTLNAEGIYYQSARNNDGICCALRLTHEDCGDAKDRTLWLDPMSVQTVARALEQQYLL